MKTLYIYSEPFKGSTKKYYSALRRITETSEELETIYKESTNGAI